MSVSHYRIELITFIQYNQDLVNQHAVITVMVDFQKAFNRQNHEILITCSTDACAMHTIDTIEYSL